MGNFRFGNFRSNDLDLIVQAPPVYNFPAKKVTSEHIPGRNGNLVIDNKCWGNVERSYSLAKVFRPGTNFIVNCEEIIKFLMLQKGYQELEDSYDPDVYRMALYKNNGSLQNMYDAATAINVTFECKPQRYLKVGKEAISFVNGLADLENPTGMDASPKITLTGLTNVANRIIMVKTEDDNDYTTSVLTIQNLPFTTITIDSELQTVWSSQNGDANPYVNLNGTQFPVLGEGSTKISVASYLEGTDIVYKYNSLLIENRSTVMASYKPYNSLVETKQSKAVIRSYDMLKRLKQKQYDAKSYAMLCQEKSEEYTFISYNTILEKNCAYFSFREDYSAAPEWLDIYPEEDEHGNRTGNIVVEVGSLTSLGESGYSDDFAYFLITDSKKIELKEPGSVLGIFPPSKSVNIYMYPADDNRHIAIGYDDKPDWLEIDFGYVFDENDNPVSIKSISYMTNAYGYYYMTKTGFLGGQGWKYIDSVVTLDTLTWDSQKLKFMPGGFSTNTAASFSYRYLSSQPQYDPTYKDKLDENGNVIKDANGNPVQEPDEEVYFRVEADSTLSNLTIIATAAGYFRCNDNEQHDGWVWINQGGILSNDTGVIKTEKSSQVIYYLSDKPTYDEVDGFPDFLETTPELYNSNDQKIPESTKDINPSYIKFVVKDTTEDELIDYSGWFRYSYYNSEDTEVIPDTWVYFAEGTPIGISAGDNRKILHDKSTTVCRMDGDSEEFPITRYNFTDSFGNSVPDIAFTDFEGTPYSQDPASQSYEDLPSWITVKIILDDNGSPVGIYFYAKETGSYNWDANLIWKTIIGDDTEHESNLIVSNDSITTDTIIHYLQEMPEYSSFTRYTIDINRASDTGNPESITIKAAQKGYYRAKSESNWTARNVGDVICDSKISESTTIYYLSDEQILSGVSISIIPRWWML